MSSGAWIFLYSIQWLLSLATLILVIGVLRKLGLDEQKQHVVSSPTRYRDGERVVGLSSVDLNGNVCPVVNLIPQGSDALVVLVSTACKSCEELLYRLLEFYTRDEVSIIRPVVLIVSGGSGENYQPIVRLLGCDSPQLKILFDAADEVPPFLGVTVVPIAFILDSNGSIRDQKLGPGQDDWIVSRLTRAPIGDAAPVVASAG